MIENGEEVGPGSGPTLQWRVPAEAAYAGSRSAPRSPSSPQRPKSRPTLASVSCPVIVFTSLQDHVVDPASSEQLIARAKGPVEQVKLERSFHVATLDYDKDEIEARTVEFVSRVLSSPQPS